MIRQDDSPIQKDEGLIVFVCLGNTCRSPMAQVIAEGAVRRIGFQGRIRIESRGIFPASLPHAAYGAREAIRVITNEDLLRGHVPKQGTDTDWRVADLILTMEAPDPKFPEGKTFNVAEFFTGEVRVIEDPYGGENRDANTLATYLRCARDLDQIISPNIGRIIRFLKDS